MRNKTNLTAHIVVKNDDQFIWYALQSILPFVQTILITDTGSSDNTEKIINYFKSSKIIFQKIKITQRTEMTKIRQHQIDETKTDWFWVVDGDEVYPDFVCKEIFSIIDQRGEKLEGIIVGRFDLLGDIYHFQDETVGAYSLFGRSGHFVLRLVNKKNIPGLHVGGVYPYEGYYDKQGKAIIDHPKDRFAWTRGRLFHAMYLQRSSLGSNLSDTFHRGKWKVDKGHAIIDTQLIPKVFLDPHPFEVPTVNQKRSQKYEFAANIVTPIKQIKRSIWKFLR